MLSKRKPSTAVSEKGKEKVIEDVDEDIALPSKPPPSKQLNKQPTHNVAPSSQRPRENQNLYERRNIRTNYRALIQDATEKKEELVQPDGDELINRVEESNNLFSAVTQPREAVLDSEFLCLVSQFGVEKTQRLPSNCRTYTPVDFAGKLKSFTGASESQKDGEGNVRDLNWESLGTKVVQYFRKSTPTFSFLYGPLSGEPAQRKQRERKEKEKDKPATLVKPTELQSTVLQPEEQDKETSKRVAVLNTALNKVSSVDYFKLIYDPLSFTQTVENIFHFSFLIKDGQAELSINPTTGVPEAKRAQPPDVNDFASGKADKKQCIITFDYNMYEKLKEKYGTGEGFLPHRKESEHIWRAPVSVANSSSSPSLLSISSVTPSQKETQDKRKKATKRKSKVPEEDMEDNEEEEQPATKKTKKGNQKKIN